MAPGGGFSTSALLGRGRRDPGEGPTIARVHDAFLGGKDAYPVDRAVVARLRQITTERGSGLEAGARTSRAFALRGVAALATAGVDQFIDLGCGYPHAPTTHEIAQRHHPGARMVYADNDTGVLVHTRALLGSLPGVGVAFAEARDASHLLTHPILRRVISLERPVGVLLVHVLEFLDDPTAARLLDVLSCVLPAGSPLLVTHITPDLLSAAAADELTEAASLYSGFVAPFRPRSIRAVTELLHGFSFVPPGMCLAEKAWKSADAAQEPGADAGTPVIAAVARATGNRSDMGRTAGP
jgi:hypothetical protein